MVAGLQFSSAVVIQGGVQAQISSGPILMREMIERVVRASAAYLRRDRAYERRRWDSSRQQTHQTGVRQREETRVFQSVTLSWRQHTLDYYARFGRRAGFDGTIPRRILQPGQVIVMITVWRGHRILRHHGRSQK